MQNLTIDGQRLWTDIQDTAAFGACEGGGLTRLTLSGEDRQVRDWFQRAAEALGCTVTIDDVGNMFARRPGRRANLDPIAIGSHLDTQPTGGKFDGVLGVLAGLEILRTLHAADYVTNAPVEVVNWTNEEGSRFAPAMLASGVFAGVTPKAMALACRDRDGTSFGEALDAIGYRGSEPSGGHRLGAMFELHIEQGPILERAGAAVGVVTGAQGARWYDVTLTGATGHTGATPMRGRRNALIAAARVVEAVDRIAANVGGDAVATVGSLQVLPNSRNVIPGEVRFSADLRHPDDAMLADMAAAFERLVSDVTAECGLDCEMHLVLDSAATHFDPRLIALVEAGAERAGLTFRRIVSGAQHDAVHIAGIVPTTMIFVPCRDGISHNVAEFASLDHCAGGTQVLLNAVLAYDDSLGGWDRVAAFVLHPAASSAVTLRPLVRVATYEQHVAVSASDPGHQRRSSPGRAVIRRLLASAAVAGVVTTGGLTWLIGSFGVRLARVIPNPRGDAEPPAEPLILEAEDGKRIAATYWPGARRDSPAVLLIPGLGAMHRRLTPNAIRFSAEGYGVLAIDLRGHGLSDPALHSFGWTESADVRAAFEWLKARQQGAKIAVIGISMGGAAALLGPAGPVPADAFILQAVFADIRSAIRCRAALFVGHRLADAVEPFLSFQSLPRFGIWPSRLAPLAATAKLKRPILVIGGERDIFVPPAEARSFFEAAPDARDLWIIPGLGHKGVSDLTSQSYQSRVLAFLRETIGPA